MKRRDVTLALLALCASGLPRVSLSQPKGGTWRVGLVFGGARDTVKNYEQAFLAAMKEHGYEVGRNLAVEVRYAGGEVARYPRLIDDVIAADPDVLVGTNTGVALGMKSRTATIPIVTATTGNPVESGLAQSLARPGGNVTGTSLQIHELGAKHIEIMLEMLPQLRRVAVLVDRQVDQASARLNAQYERLTRIAAAARGLAMDVFRVDGSGGIPAIFRQMRASQPDALLISLSPRLNRMRRELAQNAAGIRLPSITSLEDYARDGGLISYGASFVESFRRAAYYVDRILKGASPADLPIEQPTKFHLVINARVARALGILIPQSLLLRADQLIE